MFVKSKFIKYGHFPQLWRVLVYIFIIIQNKGTETPPIFSQTNSWSCGGQPTSWLSLFHPGKNALYTFLEKIILYLEIILKWVSMHQAPTIQHYVLEPQLGLDLNSFIVKSGPHYVGHYVYLQNLLGFISKVSCMKLTFFCPIWNFGKLNLVNLPSWIWKKDYLSQIADLMSANQINLWAPL